MKQIKIRAGKGFIRLADCLKKDLDIFYDDMFFSEMDIVICVDGAEGSGKSRTARVLGQYLSTKSKLKFTSDNIHFNSEDYIKASEAGVPFQVNIMDESRQALNKKRSMSTSNVMFTNWLSENRDKRQVHILLLPAIHDMDSYVSIWRMSMLLHHIKTHKKNDSRPSGYELVRGYFKMYENSKNLQKVILNKNKYGFYAYPFDYKYRRRMLSEEPFSDAEYERYCEKKAEKRNIKYDAGDGITKTETKFKDARNVMIMDLVADGMPKKKVAEIAKVRVRQVNEILNNLGYGVNTHVTNDVVPTLS